MKDIEKIKSEDLGCQVQDANPGNFAIEQEVAQLVGATVPAPTEPSADDARELGAQLLVFLRRALSPIRSALRTAVAAIYAHLDSRCTDYTPAAYDPFRLPAGPYDPMRPFVPRTLPNLLTALTAFSARKISNGSAPNDGIPDGVSLARLLGSYDRNSVTKLYDDNVGWTLAQQYTIFPNLTDIVLCCDEIANNVYVVQDKATVTSISLPNLRMLRGGISKNCANVASISVPNLEEITTQYMTAKAIANSTALTHIEFPKLRKITQQTGLGQQYETNTMFYGCTNLIDADFPVLEELAVFSDYNPRIFAACGVQVINMPKLTKISNSGSYGNAWMWFSNLPNLRRIVFGKLETCAVGMFNLCPALIDIELGQGTAINLDFSAWNPTDKGTTFLQNFKEHIALRLTANGSGKTLTLSQAVRDAIHAAEATYGIEAIIVTQKGWTLSPAPGASSQ